MSNNWHIRAGWTWSAFNGARGGWEKETGTTRRIVCPIGKLSDLPESFPKPPKGDKWYGWLVRHEDGATLHCATFRTRDDAMRALGLQVV